MTTTNALERITQLVRHALHADRVTVRITTTDPYWTHLAAGSSPRTPSETREAQRPEMCPSRERHSTPLVTSDGQPIGTLETAREAGRPFMPHEASLLEGYAQLIVTELETRAVKRERSAHARLLNDLGEAVISTDTHYRIRTWNAAATSMYGWTEAELLGHDIETFIPTEFEGTTREEVYEKLTQTGHWEGEVRQARRDGSSLLVHSRATLTHDENGTPTGLVAVNRDVSEPRALMAHLQRLAYHDPLTGLPNRVLFQEKLKQACYTVRQHGTLAAVGMLDLDGFKRINESFGHAIGDELLKLVAQRLRGVIRADSTLARMSGDEFALLIPNLERETDLAVVAERLVGTLNEPFRAAGQELFVRGGLGMAVYPLDTTDDTHLLSRADIAMYDAKRHGIPWRRFTPATLTPSREHLALETALHHALERGEFSVHYQPVMRAGARTIAGFEALLRWTHPQLGSVSPAEFIPIAERTGLIVPIGRWVMREACRELSAWQAISPNLRMGVNLSARQFRHPHLIQDIAAVLSEHQLCPSALVVEITESVLMDADDAEETLHRLRALGVTLSIDDFGTGYSSMTYLKRFPVNALKIDRSFLDGVEDDPDGLNASIVRSLVHLARNIGLQSVVEGVETLGQARFVEQVGCTHLQGWLFAKAMPAGIAEAVLRERCEIEGVAFTV